MEGYLANAIPFHSPVIIGWDAAGVIKDIGPYISKFVIGDKVFTSPDLMRNRTYAEYVAVDENMVAKKPENLSFEEAASIPLVGLTAWIGLIEKVFNLSQVKEAHDLIETGHSRGKIVLKI